MTDTKTVQPGMTGFTATVYDPDRTEFLGVFASADTAATAVYDWVLRQWTLADDGRWAPWVIDFADPGAWRDRLWDTFDMNADEFDAKKTAWLAGKDQQTVVDTYFGYWTFAGYSVDTITVK